MLGIPSNAQGDLFRFLIAAGANLGIAIGLILFFTYIRTKIPIMYSRKAVTGLAPTPLPPSVFDFHRSWFGWITASLHMPATEVVRTSGLDGLKLLEFSEFVIKTLSLVAGPALFGLCPLYFWFGGGVAAKNGEKLAQLSMANVESGSPVFWIAGCFVVYVVLVVEWMVLAFMARFTQQRMTWLRAMPYPRNSTVLVEDIPIEYRHDSLLKEHIEHCFKGVLTGNIAEATMVKHTQKLLALEADHKDLDLQLKEAKVRLAKHDRQEDEVLIAATEQHMKRKHAEVVAERERILSLAAVPWRELVEAGTLDEIYTDTAFITFSERRSAAIVVGSPFCVRRDAFRMTIPPHPSDVLYSDFWASSRRQEVQTWVGLGLILVLFFTYIPLISGAEALCNMDTIRRSSPRISAFFVDREMWVGFIEGTMSSWLLIGIMGFVPSLFMAIFKSCFRLRANQWMQVTLQRWYFWFMVTFTILITTIDTGLWDFVWRSTYDPNELFLALAINIPRSSHFYFSYIVAQYMTHSMNLTRYSVTAKYLLYRLALDPEDAAEMAEPEDQEYYGLGGRCARWSISFTIAMVYCTLAPLILPLVIIEFAFSRLIYSYLIVFAETKKPDLGGVFFVQQLMDVQWGLLLFLLTMFSVFMMRAGSDGPAFMCFICLFVVAEGYRRFLSYTWEVLPIMESEGKAVEEFHDDPEIRGESYVQAELRTS